MKKTLFFPLQVSLCTVGCFQVSNSIAQAQITPDGTVNTVVTPNGNVSEITGGETRGGNLFHSFQNFSVPAGNEAFFNNANSISNIFSRVTGGNISNINGAIRANGTANLFLINPAGIIFGENARLDIGGSFLGSTASSILFEEGEFSAADLTTPPLLTVNAPIGLGFRDNPQPITNLSIADDVGLRVDTGKNITLVGGDIFLDGGLIFAPGGRVELGGLAEEGTVSFNDDLSLNFSENFAKSNISLTNEAVINVRADSRGLVAINSRNLEISEGSKIRAGIAPELGSPQSIAGNININSTETVTISGADTFISNAVVEGAIGNAGDVNITTESLILNNGGQANSLTQGEGNAGNVNIAVGNILFDGEDSGVFSTVASTAIGNGGEISIRSNSLSLTNGAEIQAGTFGQGNAGKINIETDSILSSGLGGGIRNRVEPGSVGNANDISIQTNELSLADGADISASNSGGEGNGGNVFIDTENLTVENGSRVAAASLGNGDAGFVIINANSLFFDGVGSNGNVSGVFSSTEGVGNAGGINITTSQLSLTNGAEIQVGTFGQGNAGIVDIQADNISADGVGGNENEFASGIFNTVQPTAVGNAGNINITTEELSLTNGGVVNSSTFGQGNAGLITVNADNISADGIGSNGFASGLFSAVDESAVGNASDINITTEELSLTNGGVVNSSTFGQGNAGLITVNADNISADGVGSNGFASGIFSILAESGVGNAGGINIETSELSLTNGGVVSSSTFGQGNAGLITVNAGNISADGIGSNGFGSGVYSAVGENSVGNAGGINIATIELSLANGAEINSSTFGQGNVGSIFIKADNLSLENGKIFSVNNPSQSVEVPINSTETDNDNIVLEIAENLTLRNDSSISAQAFGNADGGNLTIDTNFIIAFPNGNSDIIANAEQGEGGIIDIDATSLFGIREGELNPFRNDINASSDVDGLDGIVNITSPNINPVQGVIEVSQNIVVPEETTAQACQSDREAVAKSSFVVSGKGGIPAQPGLPLDSQNIITDNETDRTSIAPQPIKTSKGKIQPARGIEVTESGEVILTAYKTNNGGDRLFEIERNCDRV